MLRALTLCAATCLPALPAAAAQDAAPGAAAPQDGGPAIDLRDARQVRAVYLDLLGRTPFPDELELAGAGSPDSLVRYLLGTRTFWEHWVEDELYYFLLIDNARPGSEVAGLAARLHAGELDVLGAVREIVSGQAFHRANPGNDTFVSVVLEQLLGVDVRREHAQLEAGKKMYDGRAARMYGQDGDSQADVVRIAAMQPGFAQGVASRAWRRLVGEEPTRARVEAWGERLREDPTCFPALVSEWVRSPEYARRLGTLRPKTDMQFLRGLSVDLARREAGPEELQRLRGALGVLSDAAPLRAVIARTLLDRHADELPRRGEIEAASFVDATFRRYLGRPPSPEEREEFLLVYAQEACEPATLVRAVVTHWEYQYY